MEEGWGATSTRRAAAAADESDDEAPSPKRRSAADNETEITEMLIIPDLDEQAEEDITLQVAEAPRNVTRKLPTMAELDAALVRLSARRFVRDVPSRAAVVQRRENEPKRALVLSSWRFRRR